MKRNKLLIIGIVALVLALMVVAIAVAKRRESAVAKGVKPLPKPNDDFDAETLALVVIRGDYGNEPERTANLLQEGYTTEQIKQIQAIVNETIY